MPSDDFVIPSPQQLTKAVTGKDKPVTTSVPESVGPVEGRWENHASEVFEFKSLIAQSSGISEEKAQPTIPEIPVEAPKDYIPPTPSDFCNEDKNTLTLSDILESPDDEVDQETINECVETMLKPNTMLTDLLGKLL